MASSVVITGIGVVSPLGLSAAELAARFCAGERAIGPLRGMGVDGALGTVVSAIPLGGLSEETLARIGRVDRLCRLFLAAATLAVDAAELRIGDEDRERVGLSFGTGLGCLLTNAEYYAKVVESGPGAASPRLFAYTVSSAAAGEVSIALGIKGANLTAHAGLAAGLQAVGYGVDLIRARKADVVLAGGADALGEAVVRALAHMGLLKTEPAIPFRDSGPGVQPGEGAALVVLERRDHALRRGARPWAHIEGYAAGFEPTLVRRERRPTALRETMQRTLGESGRGGAEVGVIMASAHGTPVDATERLALAAVCRGGTPLVFAPKQAWGESFAASGMLSLALATMFLQTPPSEIRAPIALEVDDEGVRTAPRATTRLAGAAVALVHGLCYSGNTVALLLGREE